MRKVEEVGVVGHPPPPSHSLTWGAGKGGVKTEDPL